MGSFLTFWGPNGLFLGSEYGSKTVLGSPHIDYQLLFSEYCSISALSCSFEFLVVVGGGWWWWWWFPAITLSQPNYSYVCFVVGVVVVVGL